MDMLTTLLHTQKLG